jgi:hypothetical protein
MKKIFLICFVLHLCSLIYAQTKDEIIQSTNFDTIKLKLNVFLNEREQRNEKSFYITGLTNDYSFPLNNKSEKFKYGIYKFGYNISHTGTYIVFVYKTYARIIKNYELENVLNEYLSFSKEQGYNYNERIKYLKLLIDAIMES